MEQGDDACAARGVIVAVVLDSVVVVAQLCLWVGFVRRAIGEFDVVRTDGVVPE